MCDPFLFREKELLKLNTELNNKSKLIFNNYLTQQQHQQQQDNSIKDVKSKKVSPKPFKKHKNQTKTAKKIDTSLEMKKPSEIEKTNVIMATFVNQNYIDGSATDMYSRITSITNQAQNTIESKTVAGGDDGGGGVLEEPLPSVSTKSIKNGSTITQAVVSDKLTKRNITSDGLIRYLKAKVILLQEELETAQKENIKKSNDIVLSLELQKKIELQHDQLYAKNQHLNQQLLKLEEVNKSKELHIKERDKEVKIATRELEQLKRHIQSLSQTNLTLERRFLKIQEDLQKSHCNLTYANDIEKECREKSRQERDMYEKQIKQLRRHRYDLLAAYKKQLLLLDNLKRQVTCLEQSKLIDFAEKEFTKILDWNKK